MSEKAGYKVIEGRYEVLAECGRGGSSAVYKVFDRNLGRVLALKELFLNERLGPGSAWQFKQEFMLTSRLRHPHTVTVYDFGLTDQGRYYFTMDFVEGQPIVEWCAERDADAIVALLLQVCIALSYIHGQGVFHGDIKPSNIIVRPKPPVGGNLPLAGSDLYDNGFATMMDFGLSSALAEPSLRVSGTVEYMAPERFMACRADVRSDLYSLGVVAYELFAKQLPFSAETVEGYIEQHLHARPAQLSSIVPNLPPLLTETVDQMLAKRPSQRPGSVAAVSAKLVEALGPRVPKTFAVPPNIQPNQLFGRAGAMRQSLRAILGRLSSEQFAEMFDEQPPYSAHERLDRCLVVLARGASGSGKTAFLDALKSELQLCELTTMVSPSGAQNLDITSFVSVTLNSAGLSSDMKSQPDDTGKSPDAGRGMSRADSADLMPPDEVGEWSGTMRQEFLKRFVDSVSDAWETRPVAWLLDDFDLTDERRCEVLWSLVRSAAATGAGRKVAIVMTSGSAASSELEQMADIIDVENVELLPLEESQVASLIDASFMPNAFSQEAAPVFLEKTGGLPALLAHCIESALAEDIVHFVDGRWELRADRLRDFAPARSLSQVVETRLSRISAGAMSILIKAGVLNECFSPSLIASLGGTSTSSAQEGLEELIRHGLLVEMQTDRKNVSYCLANPVLGQIVSSRVLQEERQAIHRLIAQRCDALAALLESEPPREANGLEELPPVEPAQLRATSAIHAVHAGLPDLLNRNYEVGCRFLMGRFRLEDARLVSATAAEVARKDDNKSFLGRALFRLGALDFVLGDHDEAVEALKEAITLAQQLPDSLQDEVMATCRLGVIFSGRGNFETARDLYQSLIDRLKAEKRKARGRRLSQVKAYLARLYTFLGQTYFGQCHYEKAKDEFMRALELVPKRALTALASDSAADSAAPVMADTRYLPRLFRNLSIIDDSAGRYRDALKNIEKAVAASRLLQDASEHARNLVTHGTISQHLGKYADAERAYKTALDQFAREGFKEGLLVAHNNLSSILALRGRPKEAAQHCSKALSMAKKLGNKYSVARQLQNLGVALFEQGWTGQALEKIDESLEMSERNGFKEVEALGLIFKVEALLAERRTQDARAAVMRLDGVVKSLDSEGIRLRAQLADASVCNAEEDYGRASQTASAVLAQSEHLDKRDASLAHRIRADAALGLGEHDSAERDISKALSLARDASAAREEALCLEVFSRIKAAEGDYAKAIELGSAAVGMFKEMEAFLKIGETAEYLSRLQLEAGRRSDALLSLELSREQFLGLGMREKADRLDDKIESLRWGETGELKRGSPALKALYRVARLFESLLDLDELLNRVMDAVIDILGAERGLIMLKDPKTGVLETRVARKVDEQTIEDVSRISKSVIQRVVDLGQPLVTTDAQSDPRFHESKSVSLYDIRSIVCVPLVINGEVVGTVYVDSSLSATVFTEQDLYLLSAFATQASMAIEKAMLLEKLQRKSESLQAENIDLREAIAPQLAFENIVGDSGVMQDVFRKIRQVADTQVAVLIEGESGTGKELVARAIHYNGVRKDGPFVKINCAAIPASLMENELFGHEKGAFTGAGARKIGKFEVADKGSLFLDEIGDLPSELQGKLLTAIENKEFQRVGGTKTIHVNVRILTATNRDLLKLVKRQRFRKDLYYRINEVPIKLPPLRERPGDIPHLAHHFIRKYSQELSSKVTGIEKDAISLLMEYDWPGNVRELESAIKRALTESSGTIIKKSDFEFLPVAKTGLSATRSEMIADLIAALSRDGLSLREMLAIVEEEVLRLAIGTEGWSIRRAAKELGISRNTLKNKLKAFNIEVPGS